ncbi:MAG: 30S ribosome-binding factor RbfA [Thermotogae bacterium]|nr:30S ribosome-binding factor RbfA [Thermotogota bacterium]
MSVYRKEMLESEMLKLLSEAVSEMKDPRVKKERISFTRVLLSNDKRYADVFVSILGSDTDIEETLEILEKAKGFFKSYIGKNIRIYTIPEIRFKKDRGIEQSIKIQQILEKINKEKKGADESEKEGD